MYRALPPLTALRAFEAAARHLSLTKAARELHVTPGALSHQIRGLEEMLGFKLFDRGARSIGLTREGEQLFPGLKEGFDRIRQAVAALQDDQNTRVLVISTPPGFTAKWLVPRLYRFSAEHPLIDARVSSSLAFADFRSDGVDVGLRTLRIDAAVDPDLAVERLVDIGLMPVCSPRLIDRHGPIDTADALKQLPLIHDDSKAVVPGWPEWFRSAGVEAGDFTRGLRFNSADHALDAVIEGAGVLLTYDVLAYDDLRTGRLVVPVPLKLDTGRAYYIVSARRRADHPNVKAFWEWIKREIAMTNWAGSTKSAEAGRSSAAAKRRRGRRRKGESLVHSQQSGPSRRR